jgi:hypothetical protein
MRKIVALVAVFVGVMAVGATQPASAQNGRSWERVQALPSGSNIQVKAAGGGGCKVKSVEAELLTCVSGDGAKTMVFQRADIRAIKIHHRGRSTAVGAGIGAGIGAITGAAQDPGISGSFLYISRGAFALVFAVVFGVFGALIGVATDFMQATIYKG